MKYNFYGSLAALLVIGAIGLAGCTSYASTPTPAATLARQATTQPTPTGAHEPAPLTQGIPATPTGPAQLLSGSTPAAGVKRVIDPEIEISFEIPADWHQNGTGWSWSPPATDTVRIGINWNEIGPGWQPTSMLPNHSKTLKTAPIDLGWAQGTVYTVEVSAPAAAGGGPVAVEEHAVVVQKNGLRGYDFYASAPTAAKLAALDPTFHHVLNSSQREK